MQINKHGSFYIRTGWPTKIIDALSTDPHIFSPNNELCAVDDIGVGRVMIKSMRYWASVLGLSVEGKDQQGICNHLTPLAKLIQKNDLYCVDRGTLWLLHRHLTQENENATAWHWAFNCFDASYFTKDEFVSAFLAYTQHEGGVYPQKTIEKEFDCFKNTYVSEQSFSISKIIDEDTIPFFSPLQLLEYKGSGKYVRRKISAKEIPIDIFLVCLILDNIEHLKTNKQIGIDHLIEDENQVCKYMQINYATLIGLLQNLENLGHLRLVNNFGNRYIELEQALPERIIESHYHMMER